MKGYYIIAAIVVVGFVVLGASSMKSSITPYVTSFDQVKSSTEDKLQTPGVVVKDKPAIFDRKENAFVFTMRDPEREEMKVVYTGVKPGNFEQADKVVAIGKYRDGAFRADQLLVKCPSKYQGKGTVNREQ